MPIRYTPEIVKFDFAPPLRHTGPEVHDVNGLWSWFFGFDGPIDYKIRDLTMTAAEDVACHSLNRLSAASRGVTRRRRGTRREAARRGVVGLWFRATVCLRKVDGTWRVTHEHNSTPFYMDGSFKAALDLQPVRLAAGDRRAQPTASAVHAQGEGAPSSSTPGIQRSVDEIPKAKQFYSETLGIRVSEEYGMLRLHIVGDRDTGRRR